MGITIQERLFALRDEGYASFTARLIPNIDASRVIGVRAPLIEKLARELNGTDEAEALIRSLPHKYLEEYGLHVALINRSTTFDIALNEVAALLPFIDNWATCDSLSPAIFARHVDELLPHVQRWMLSPHEYICRFGIGMLMRYYLDDNTFCPEQLQWVAEIDRAEYYVRMMQAWYFATAIAKQWSSALAYFEQGAMPEWVRRKAIQKSVESRRLTAEQKTILRSMK